MPKTRRQRRSSPSRQTAKDNSLQALRAQPAASRPVSPLAPHNTSPLNLVFSAMLALGCWGMAFFFIFLTPEANHLLFGGMAALMALLWSFSFGLRVRKLLQQRTRM